MNPYEMKPNGQNLYPGRLLRSLAERKTLLTVPMTLVRVSDPVPARRDSSTYYGESRVRIRDWQRSFDGG
jgi:hypothetical protein